MTAPSSQLKVDYKPGGEAHVHKVHVPRVRRRFWLLLALAITGGGTFQLFFASVATAGHNNRAALAISSASPVASAPTLPTSSAAPTAPSKVLATASIIPAAPGTKITPFTVHRGDTLGRLFASNHLSATDLYAIMALGGDTDRLKRIRVGQVITIGHDADGRIFSLSMKLDDAHTL
ncbi:MAG: LysM-like peptidoglycan-binding domain-containing protein, partial [Gammaproteobacteria bacterium]